MFHKPKYEDRLAEWSAFRQSIDKSDSPIADTLKYYDSAPRVSINTDPWDDSTWPDPWELIHENQYCAFCILLGICYTLQLTEYFTRVSFEIYIGIDRNNSKTVFYLCIDNQYVVEADELKVFDKTKLTGIEIEKIYTMPDRN